ncbi:PAS domain S-box protein [Variovorax sp. J22G21]|uniref:hybrid sensor histidine kinase/response regulator n=1 Tax=Variovorax fucosicus TaxID=3053517 RepID=UPI002575A1F9|nr:MULTISPECIES: PAS domain S-box protein [unclassified Variovorax]MDM0040401.1 PAS domain S-box protein [Variovorax sp. J22R193]MDM0061774.1 PAS domain S-box protein [Variovorax sp. J22G21]
MPSLPDQWPIGDSETADLVRRLGAADSPLGAPAQWPVALRTTIDLLLPSQAQIVLFWGPDFVAFYNDAYAPTIGHKHPAALGRPACEHWTELWDDLRPLLERVLLDGETVSANDRPFLINRHGEPEQVFFDISYSPVREIDGRVGGVLCIVSETTGRVRMTQALAASESRTRETNRQLQMAQAAGGIGVFLLDIQADTLSVSAEFCRIFGMPVRTTFDAFEIDRLRLNRNERMSTRENRTDGSAPLNVEYRIRRAGDGALRWISRRAEMVRDDAGRPILMRGVVQDITAQKWAEATLRESEARFRALAQAVPNQVWTAAADGQLDWFSESVYAYSQLTHAELAGNGWTCMVHPEDLPRVMELWARSLALQSAYETEFRLRRHDGAWRWHLVRAQPLDAEADVGVPVRWVGTNTDIDDQKAAQARLERSVEERTRDRDRLWHLSTDIMVVADFGGRITAINPAWEELLGWTETELLGSQILDVLHQDDVAAAAAELGQLARGHRMLRFECRLRHRDGSYRTVSWTAVPDDQFLHAVGRDITALRESEARLRQSQKMEAIGQLTGGIAHDFNNLLQGITGSIEVMRRRVVLGRTEGLERYMDAATQSAQRAASLIQRLLAFSRRQTLDTRPVDVSRLIGSIEELLRRTLGEQVQLEVQLDADAGAALCDESQLESAILNLAINARDAMPHGGELHITASQAVLTDADTRGHDGLEPGHYCTIAVADSGTGMPPDVLAKAFDPFFTTKPIGQGTGLGLSMVYGFVQQSLGHVHIQSQVGQGTTVTLFLPRAGSEDTSDSVATAAAALPHGSGEVVLVVEDDPGVRLLVLDVLEDLGYRTLQAADGGAAVPILQSGQRIDLLVSDVGLPGINGRQLAEIARQHRPGLDVLFMTGYAEHATTRAEFLAPGMQMIAKPFAIDDFAHMVEQIVRRQSRTHGRFEP